MQDKIDEVQSQLLEIENLQIPFLTIINKSDLLSDNQKAEYEPLNPLYISAKEQIGVEELKDELINRVQLGNLNTDDVMVTNIRHVEALQKTSDSLERVLFGIDNPVTSDFLAMDIRQALYHLGEITGSVSTDDLLDNIFSKFCIGK
ncbi:tRNA modification GTPase MnmE [compost metagenome]